MEVSSDQYLWRVDLHSLGYPSDNPGLQLRRGPEEFDTVDFVSEGGLVASFLTKEPPALQRRNDPNRVRPYRLHALFLDAATGKVLKALEWSADDPRAGIFPRYDGGFLFFSTDHVIFYSADWTQMKELQLPQLTAPHSSLAGIAESPSAKMLVVRFHQGQRTLCVHIPTGALDAF